MSTVIYSHEGEVLSVIQNQVRVLDGDRIAEVDEVSYRRRTDMGRKVFRALRHLEGGHILAALHRRVERGADSFIGFGHPAEDLDREKVEGEDSAAQVDLEILNRLSRNRHFTISDLGGMSPEDFFALQFAAEARPPP